MLRSDPKLRTSRKFDRWMLRSDPKLRSCRKFCEEGPREALASPYLDYLLRPEGS